MTQHEIETYIEFDKNVSKNLILNKLLDEEKLRTIFSTSNKIPYIEIVYVNVGLGGEEYKKWKQKVHYQFKKEGLVFDARTDCSYTYKKFIY